MPPFSLLLTFFKSHKQPQLPQILSPPELYSRKITWPYQKHSPFKKSNSKYLKHLFLNQFQHLKYKKIKAF
jgi:hypothetical protein